MDVITVDPKLDSLIEKRIKTRQAIAKILTKDFGIDDDFAELISLDATAQALNLAVKNYRTQRFLRWVGKNKTLLFKTPLILGGVALAGWILWIVLAWIGGGLYSWWTTPAPPFYPHKYVVKERVRFADTSESMPTDGLLSTDNLCFSDYNPSGKRMSCLRGDKLDEVNNFLNNAVSKNTDGLVVRFPNGNGEIWTVERNNKRFIITTEEDPDFIR